MKPLRVGIMAGVYWPEAGGSATYLHLLKQDLERRGHHVRVICYGEEPSERDVVRVSRNLPIPLRIAVFTYWAARWLRDRDVWFINEYGFSALVLRPFLRIPTVMKIVGDWAWESAVNQRRFPMSPIDARGRFHDPLASLQSTRQHPMVELRKTIRSVAARAADMIFVPSHYLARIVEAWGVPASRIKVIHNGMVAADDVADAQPHEPGLIVTVARLVAWKGVDHLIAAVAQLAATQPRAHLLVLGDGPERARLESLAASTPGLVTFAGHVPRSEVHRQLARAEAFVLASAYEGLPHVVLEAMSEGCPAVAAGAGGTPEVIRDGVDGLLVPYGDSAALAEALAQIIGSAETRARFAEAGRARLAEAFTWERTSAAAIDLLESVAVR